MLNYKVTCDNCMTTILLTEESLMQSSSIVCPKCDSKLPANEMKHLKSDLQYRKKHSGFHISIYDEKDTDLLKITSLAFDQSLDCLLRAFENNSVSEKDINKFLSDNNYLLNYCRYYSNALLVNYHYTLASILRDQEIGIGNLIRPQSAPSSDTPPAFD